MFNELIKMDMLDLHLKMRSGKITAEKITKAASDNYLSTRNKNNSYITWRGDDAVINASKVDKLLSMGIDHGPLMGMPISIKDLYAVPSMPTYAGSKARLPTSWESAGPIVKCLIDQMPSIMGKTHTVEFAFGGLGTNPHWGTPWNPHDPINHRAPGGSSSGAGVSIYEGSACLAFGTDTAGSVRIPASMTGVVGLKTTAGRWPTEKIVPLSHTLDSPGMLTKTVRDMHFCFHAIDSNLYINNPRLQPSINLPNLKVGIANDFFWSDCHSSIIRPIESAINALKRNGINTQSFNFPNIEEAYEIFKLGGLAATELYSFIKSELPENLNDLDSTVKARLKDGENILAWEYIRRKQLISNIARDISEELNKVDVVVLPTTQISPPLIEELKEPQRYSELNMLALKNTFIGNFANICGITIPVGRDNNNMPIGMQLYSKSWNEENLIEIALAFEACIGDHKTIFS